MVKWYFDHVYHGRDACWFPLGHFGFFTAREDGKSHRVLVSEMSFEGEFPSHLQMLLGTKAGHCEIPEVFQTMIPMLQHSLFWLEFDPNTQ